MAYWTDYYASWPEAGTVAFINQARSLYNQRLANCPPFRAVDKFIILDAAGSAVGGGGSGSEADPWKVRHLADLKTLIEANQGTGNIRFNLRGGDIFYGTDLITVSQPNITIGRYGVGYPILTAFLLESSLQAGAWTQVDGNRWAKTFTGMTDLTWVRGTGALSAIRSGTEVAFRRVNFTIDPATTLALVRDNPNTFYMEESGGNTTVHVNVGGNPAGAVMIARGETQAGIRVLQVHGCRIEEIDFIGLCIQNINNERVPLLADISGTQECVFNDCAVYYGGSAHSILQLNSTGGAGGVLTYHRCKAGYMVNPTDGEGVLLTSYNAFGGQEMYVHDFEATYGTLPEVGQLLRRGAPFYCHTSGATPYIGLALILKSTVKNHVHGLKANGKIGAAPPYTTSHCHTDEYRAWIIDEVVEDGDGTFPDHDDVYVVRINDRFTFKPLTIADADRASKCLFNVTFSARKAAYLNCLWEYNLANSSGGVNAIRHYGTANHGEPMTFLHHHLLVRDQVAMNYAWHVGQGDATQTQIANKRMFNSIIQVDDNTSAVRQQICNNAAPSTTKSDTVTSGYSHCAYWSNTTIQKTNSGSGGTLRLGYDLGTNFRDNATSPALGAAPVSLANPGTGLSGQGTSTLPIAVEYDINYRVRPASPSIGPVEVNTQPFATLVAIEDVTPPAGPCDTNPEWLDEGMSSLGPVFAEYDAGSFPQDAPAEIDFWLQNMTPGTFGDQLYMDFDTATTQNCQCARSDQDAGGQFFIQPGDVLHVPLRLDTTTGGSKEAIFELEYDLLEFDWVNGGYITHRCITELHVYYTVTTDPGVPPPPFTPSGAGAKLVRMVLSFEDLSIS